MPQLRSPVAVAVLKQEDTAGAGVMGPAPLLAAAAGASGSKGLPLSPADAALAQQMAQVNGAPLDAEVSAGLFYERTVCGLRHAQLVCRSLRPSGGALLDTGCYVVLSPASSVLVPSPASQVPASSSSSICLDLGDTSKMPPQRLQ